MKIFSIEMEDMTAAINVQGLIDAKAENDPEAFSNAMQKVSRQLSRVQDRRIRGELVNFINKYYL